jgi:Xaa-Pro aminopeptidase/Xaa-Pro dipeptidase
MFHLGEPKEEFIRAYEAVLQARKRGLEAARAGEEIARMDEAVREVLAEHGYSDRLIYTTGHGVGLEVHEPPIVSSTVPEPEVPKLYSDGDVQRMYKEMRAYLTTAENPRFQENTVIALEPGIYFKDFGVRVEDMVLIKGKARLLSSSPVKLEDMIII